jgi:hypothetical protein
VTFLSAGSKKNSVDVSLVSASAFEFFSCDKRHSILTFKANTSFYNMENADYFLKFGTLK